VFELLRYRAANGCEPFTEWIESIQDKQVQARVLIRLRRLKSGLFGDCESVGEGILELRERHGAGIRIYFGRHGGTIVILLCGGTKRTQVGDIKAARECWNDWKRRRA
jgi:putative addiction module killer protein